MEPWTGQALLRAMDLERRRGSLSAQHRRFDLSSLTIVFRGDLGLQVVVLVLVVLLGFGFEMVQNEPVRGSLERPVLSLHSNPSG